MTTAVTTSAIARLLDDIRVAPGALHARVADRALDGDTPRELRARLADELYRRYHMGRSRPAATAPRSSRDPRFEERLRAAMPHHHRHVVVPAADAPVTPDAPAAPVTPGAPDGSGPPGGPGTVVALDGLRVTLPAERVAGAAAGSAVRARLDAARPALSPGFFLCDGSRERRTRSTATLRVYVHLTEPDSADAAWGAVLRALEAEQIPYRAKIASARTGYPRRDALVVYLGSEGWQAAGHVARSVAALPGRGHTVSPFVRELAPGVGAAWEPDDRRPGMRGVSFGEHRAAAVADGLVRHAEDPAARPRAEAVREALREAGIDPADPARNLRSPHGVLPAPTAR